jgi:2,3-diaminopropionate biosynthesis protein SbnA
MATPIPAGKGRDVMVISAPHEFNQDDLYVNLEPVFGHSLFLKCEGFNFAGSVKLKAARQMVEEAEREGRLRPDSVLVESSSGNLGVALSIVAASKGYRFLCVTDARCNRATLSLMEALGGQVHIITVPAPDCDGGFLGARMQYIRKLCEANDRYVWMNQYENSGNWRAHFNTTGPSIAKAFPNLDVLFIGAGTTGTLMGTARFMRQSGRPVRIVAVDAVGSVTFGSPPAPRLIPGLGMGVHPPLLDKDFVDEVILVEEADTIRACHELAARGYLFGGSTGTVVSAANKWLAENGGKGLTAVAIAPDFGERYLQTIYQNSWVCHNFGEKALCCPLEQFVEPAYEENVG